MIYDVGLFDGEDTAYYLSRGYRVVAIDANPASIASARVRFAPALASQRLVLLNVAMGTTTGTAEFWISQKSEWSSFDRSLAGKDDMPHWPIQIEVTPLDAVFLQYGVPHYLKIDIEGWDHVCVESLSPDRLPPYISVEAECSNDRDALTEAQSLRMLHVLRKAGYTRFKLVNEALDWKPVHANRFHRMWQRGLHSLATGKLAVPGISGLISRFTDAHRIKTLYPFQFGSTGPWGEDVPGRWMSFEEAESVYREHRRDYFSSPQKQSSFWFDWHATR